MKKQQKSQLMKDVDFHLKNSENLEKIRTIIRHLKRIERCEAVIKESKEIIARLDEESKKRGNWCPTK